MAYYLGDLSWIMYESVENVEMRLPPWQRANSKLSLKQPSGSGRYCCHSETRSEISRRLKTSRFRGLLNNSGDSQKPASSEVENAGRVSSVSKLQGARFWASPNEISSRPAPFTSTLNIQRCRNLQLLKWRQGVGVLVMLKVGDAKNHAAPNFPALHSFLVAQFFRF